MQKVQKIQKGQKQLCVNANEANLR